MMQGFLLLDLFLGASVLAGRFLLPIDRLKGILLVMTLFISVTNYKLLVKNDKWMLYQAELDSYSQGKRISVTLAVVGAFALSMLGIVLLSPYTQALYRLTFALSK